MKLTEEQINHILREVESVDFGRVVIEINSAVARVDVVTERRTRFEKGACTTHKKRVDSQ